EAIEEQVTLLRLMSEMVTDEQGLAASIGAENEAFGLPEASIVASNYMSPGGTARVGVMGPTRMDYPSNLAAARAVARYLSRLLDEDEAGRCATRGGRGGARPPGKVTRADHHVGPCRLRVPTGEERKEAY